MNNDLIVYQIERLTVEEGTLQFVQDLVRKLESQGSAAHKSIVVTFSGYDNVVDEIYEIKEIREWVKKLVNRYPHFFYFLADIPGYGREVLLPTITDVENTYFGERKPPTEWLALGVNPIDEVPPMNLDLHLDKNLFNIMKSGLKRYGKKVNDPDGATDVIKWLERFI